MKSLINYLIIVTLIFSLSVKSLGQATVTLNVDANPTPQLALWADRDEIAMLTVENSDLLLEDTDYIIKTKMFLDGALVFETDNNVEVQSFELGTQIFIADEIIPYSSLIFHSNSFQNHLIQTGMLPPGSYSFCVQLLDLSGNLVSTPNPMVCQPMTITEYDMPVLLYPPHFLFGGMGDTIMSQLVPNIIFSWTPLTPNPPIEDGIKYILIVVEAYDYQSATQAIFTNYPIIEEEVDGTEFQWPSDLDAPTEPTKYAWSVKPVTDDGNFYQAGNNGFVPAKDFVIILDDDIEIEDCDCTNSLQQPTMTITQPEPILFPRKLELGNVIAIRDFVMNCNDNISLASHNIVTTINWDSDHSSESIISNGPFQHQFSEVHLISEEVCIAIEVSPKPGYNGGQCSKQFCVNVPQNIQDLNVDSTNTTIVAANDTIYAGQNGEFAVAVTDVSSNNGSLTGEGSVYIDWLNAPVEVSFENIMVDSAKHLQTGTIVVKTYQNTPQYPANLVDNAVNTGNWTNNLVDTLVEWFNAQGNICFDYNGANYVANPKRVPLGIKFQADDTLAITEIVFRPNKSEFNVLARRRLQASWGQNQTVGFRAKNIIFHPTQIVMPPTRLELVEDLLVGNINNNITYTFKKPTNPTSGGCYIQWDENGFDEFGIEIDAAFTRDWLIPTPDNGERAIANFVGVAGDWDDILLVGNFTNSELVDSDSMTLSVTNITMDLSDFRNPPNIVFPDNYPAGAETTNLFRGFYMQSGTLSMPRSWQSHSGGTPNISLQNVIINNTGFTFLAEATNVAQFPNVSVADMAASIDTVYLDMVSNSITEAGIKGRIALPVTDPDSITNPLKYNAIFNNAQAPGEHNSFQLTIEPTGPIYAKFLKGEMDLAPTSQIVAYIDSTKKTFEISLNGNFVWNDIQLGPVKNVNFDLGFENLGFSYNSSHTQNNKMLFTSGSWSFASPQKKLANFPVTIEDINFHALSTNPNQYIHGNLDFDVVVNLKQEIGGRTSMGVELSVDKNTNPSASSKFVPKYHSTHINQIDVYAHLSAVSIEGSILFRNDDPVYGNGFIGNLNATFKTPAIGISALAEFGNTNYQHNAPYRYWRVEADATFTPGIPFLPGVAFYGFGGGAFNNMEASISGTTYSFTPHFGYKGFKVKAKIGTTPDPKTFNADVGLMGQFSNSGGLINIGFTGDFYAGAPMTPDSKRQKAQIKGSVLADYNFPDKHFFFTANVNINKAPAIVANNQNLVLDIQGKTNKWYFKYGTANAPNTAEVFGLNLYSYLMFGNDIDPPSGGFSQQFKNGYYDVFSTNPGISTVSGVDANSATGKGFAMGVGMTVDKSINKHVTGNYYIDLGFSAGAEVNLSMLEYNGQNCANTSQKTGLNGYRARGDIGFYAAANAAVQRKNSSGNVTKTWNLATVQGGGWLVGTFPRPTYVKGALDGNIQVGGWQTRQHALIGDCSSCGQSYHLKKKDGHTSWRKKTSCTHYVDHYLVDQNFHSDFEWGDDCAAGDNSTSTNSSATYAQGDAAADQTQKLIKYVHPLISNNFPKTAPIAVKYGLPLNESFDVAEQQSNGSILTRTFKLVAAIGLKEAGSNIFHTHNQNNLGEDLYSKAVPITMVASANLPAMLLPNNSAAPNMVASTAPSMTASAAGKGGGTASNANNSAVVGGSMIMFASASLMFPVAAPVVNNPSPPAPPIVNSLLDNTQYQITITATLKEYKNNSWVDAVKADGSPVMETITKNFNTGPVQLMPNNTSSSK